MASTSMSLGKHWEDYLKKKVASGEYGSATEVVRSALRDMAGREAEVERLQALVQEGEESGYIKGWTLEGFLKRAEAMPQDAFGETDPDEYDAET